MSHHRFLATFLASRSRSAVPRSSLTIAAQARADRSASRLEPPGARHHEPLPAWEQLVWQTRW